jgi:hypothetical protein
MNLPTFPIGRAPVAAVRQLSIFRRFAERLRQRDEHRRLGATDAVVLSFDAATERRMASLLTRLGVPANGTRLLYCSDDRFDCCLRDDSFGEHLFDKKLVLVTRHPADIVFDGDDGAGEPSVSSAPPRDRARCDTAIMPLIQRMNHWAREFGRFRHLLLIRDCDLRGRPHATLDRILQFLGCPAGGAAIRDALAAEALDSPAADVSASNAAKTAERDRINAIVAAWLAPVYGYDSMADDRDSGDIRDGGARYAIGS